MKIKIKDFFDIFESELELKPIMVICGDNGTGKTHLIKLVSTVRELLLNGSLFKLNERELDEVQRIIDFTQVKEKLLLKQNADIKISEERLTKLYEFLELMVNRNLKNKLEFIWNTTFGQSSIKQNKIGDIEIEFNNKVSNLNLAIEFNKCKEENFILANEISKLNSIVDDKTLNEIVKTLSVMNKKPNYLKFIYEVRTSEYVSHRGLSMFGENLKVSDKFNTIIESALENIFSHICIVELELKDSSSDFYYLPASREAYHRDLEFFRRKLKDDDNILISKYFVDKKGRKTSNFNSKDPFVEKYVENVTEILTRDNSYREDDIQKNLLTFLEQKILKAEILVDSSSVKYKLPDKEIITPNMASSLQNEYAFLKILIERSNKASLTIEEPESHLSIKNATKLMYFLLTYQYLNNNLLWLTTHNNFISDAINNFIMISKLKAEEQQKYLKLIGLDEVLTGLDNTFEDRVAAYLICDSTISRLPKSEYGINFENFTIQINDLINISLDLQVEMDNNVVSE